MGLPDPTQSPTVRPSHSGPAACTGEQGAGSSELTAASVSSRLPSLSSWPRAQGSLVPRRSEPEEVHKGDQVHPLTGNPDSRASKGWGHLDPYSLLSAHMPSLFPLEFCT